MIFYTSFNLNMPDGTRKEHILGLASFYGDRHEELYEASYETYWSSHHDHKYEFIEVTCIKEVVMMAPDPTYVRVDKDYTGGDRWYMMRKPGVAFARHLE